VGIVVVNRGLDFLKGIFSVFNKFTKLFTILKTENHQEAVNDVLIEFFVITNKDFSLIFIIIVKIILQARKRWLISVLVLIMITYITWESNTWNTRFNWLNLA
jgi:hypothetical protein